MAEKKADINTLTPEQKELMSIGYTFVICKQGKLRTIEPKEITPEFIAYKKKLIEENFIREVKDLTTWYSQEEIDSWEKKQEEAKKVLAGEKSEFLETLAVEWENVEDLAKLILGRAEIYAIEFAKIENRKRQEIKELESGII